MGEDFYVQILGFLLNDAGIVPALVYKQNVSTELSFNLTSRGGDRHNMFIAGTANAVLDADTVLPKLREVVPKAKTMYFGGCFKLKGLQPVFSEIVAIADASSVTLVVDLGRIPEGTTDEMLISVRDLVMHVSYYLPSREEFCTLWGVNTVNEGLRLLYDYAPKLTTIVKDSSNGAYCLSDSNAQHVPAESVSNIRFLTGAGDSFNAGFIAAIMCEQPIAKAVAFAHSVAAAKISGQATPKLRAT